MRTVILLLTAPLLVWAGSASADGTASTTRLTAAQEVQDPPVESAAVARGRIEFDDGLTSARVDLVFSRLEGDFTRLHLHCAVAGANGPIAIGLIDSVAPDLDNSDVISLEGRYVFGTLTNAEFPEMDACEAAIGRPINNIASLAAAIDAGSVYWNLHTSMYPAGEVRGQVRPLEATNGRR